MPIASLNRDALIPGTYHLVMVSFHSLNWIHISFDGICKLMIVQEVRGEYDGVAQNKDTVKGLTFTIKNW